MTDQKALRRRIARLEAQQEMRRERTEIVKTQLDQVIDIKERELENLRAQVTIREVEN